MPKVSQENKILKILEDDNWHCSSEFYAQYMADPRARLFGLKKKGYQLESRKCQSHNFHDGNSKEWRLVGENLPTGEQMTTRTTVYSENRKTFNLDPNFCCASRKLYGVCARDCKEEVKIKQLF